MVPWVGDTVLDLAAGTGKLTELLARHAGRVIAVEPVEGMRQVLAAKLPGAEVLDGTAEAIPLDSESVDAAFVAEAFHWFDHRAAAAELARVIRPGGALVLLWNEPVLEEGGWHRALYDAVARHRLAGAASFLRDAVPWREALEAEERFGALTDDAIAHEHHSDREELVAFAASMSAIGGLPTERRRAALDDVRATLEEHGVEEIAVPYRALVTATRRR